MLRIRKVGLVLLLIASACRGCGGSSANRDAGGPVIDSGTPRADGGMVPPGVGDGPAVARGGEFFGTAERFNRYYTDPAWKPAKTLFVSPTGGGDGSSAQAPTTLAAARSQLAPGTLVELLAGTYADTCVNLDDAHSGSYDQPVVFRGQRSDAGALAVTIECCDEGNRPSCFNLEGAHYVAIDSLELIGGSYGVRAVGEDFAADRHQLGVAVLRSNGHDQFRDPFFTGQSDWYVIEGVSASNAQQGDGHGIYLSNGSDWLIVRANEVFNNVSADFQINADPIFSCTDVGIPDTGPECDAVAGTHPTGGRGASDFVLVERNYFHDGLAQGANFTSVRNSLVRNNVFAFYARHGVSFWQETTNPKLGSRDNRIVHNLFVTTNDQHAVQFIESSTGNTFAQNVVLGVTRGGGAVSANPDALLLEADKTVGANVYSRNVYVGGRFDGHEPGSDELRQTSLDPAWFAAFPASLAHVVTGFAPTAAAPWAKAGELLPDAPADYFGKARRLPTALGPIAP